MNKSKSKIQNKKAIKQEELIKNNKNFECIDIDISKPDNDFLLNNLHAPLFVKDFKHRWVYMNKAMCNLLGVKNSKQLLGKSDYDVFPEEEANTFWEKDNIVFETGKENINEENFTVASGNTYHIQTRKTLHLDKDGNKYIFGTILDITELTKAREAEKENLRNLEFLSHSATEFIQLPVDANIFDFIGKKIHNLIDNSIVALVSYNKTENVFKLESVQTNNSYQKIEKILGKEYMQNAYMLTPFYLKLEKGALTRVDGGLYDLIGKTYNKKICTKLEKELNINYVYAIGLIHKNIVAGSAVLFLRDEIKPAYKEIVETFTRQATIAFQKNQISKELMESESKYRKIFENILNVYIEIGVDGRILEMSNSVEIYSGFKREELIGKNMKCIFAKEIDYQEFITALKTQNTLRDYEIITIDKKGIEHFCLINVKTEMNTERSKPVKYVGIINDISERKKTLELLNSSKEKYKEIFDNVNDLIFTMNMDGKLTSVNRIAKNIIGNEINNKKEFNIKEFLLPESYIKVMEGLDRLIKNSNFRIITTVDIKTFTGEIITLEVNCLLRMKKGKPYELFGIARDITERNQIENEIKASLKEKEVLLSEIHHRVKNNMQVIVSLINMHIKKIKDNILSEELVELKNRVMAMSMIHEDLYMSKNLSKIDLTKFVKKISKSLILTYNGHGNIRQHFDVSKIYIDIDKAIPFGLVVNELICNAFKYAFPEDYIKNNNIKATINIKFKKLKKDIELIISDNGVGLPQNIDVKNPKTMGLSLVDILVNHQLKGSITVKNEKGTAFKILIPIE